jgi:hypothetical protein
MSAVTTVQYFTILELFEKFHFLFGGFWFLEHYLKEQCHEIFVFSH